MCFFASCILETWKGDSLVTSLWFVFQAQDILQEYLLAMTTDEQLLNHTSLVSPWCPFGYLYVLNQGSTDTDIADNEADLYNFSAY